MSLAEVMVFLVLATMAVLGLVSAQVYSLRSSEGGRERAVAGSIAYSTMSAAQRSLRHNFSQSVAQPRAPVPGHEGYEVALEQIYEPDGKENLKHITCRVFWTDEQEYEYVVFTSVFHGP